ncbi:MAG: M16 family metallopeptidase [Phycisphaerales bacterium]
MRQKMTMTLAAALAATLAGTLATPAFAQSNRPKKADAVPTRPEDIVFRELKFDPPNREDYRHELSNGVVVYLAPSNELPLVNITFSFKGGEYLVPEGKEGLAQMTASMMRRGGTESVSASEMDEQFDFLAANAGVFAGGTSMGANLNSLSSNLDESFGLFMDMLKNPGFDGDKTEIYRAEVLEALKQRNDNPASISNREWNALMYGEDHFEARQPTKQSVESLTVQDMRDFHDKVFNRANLIIGVSGDFEQSAMLQRLERATADMDRGTLNPEPPAPTAQVEPGVYFVEKDIPQGRVLIGQRGITRDHPDYFPMLVLNDVLGGGGFTSRLTKRIRSDEGLAYSAGSANITPYYYPGEWRAGFQSKSRTVAYAAQIVFDELERVRTEPISEEELNVAKNQFIETFPRTFESRQAIVNVFIGDERTNRARDYWETYRDNIRAVSAEDALQAAKRHLDPKNLAILIVGKWDEIKAGDLEGRATMDEFFDGRSTEIPLKDPETLEPMN